MITKLPCFVCIAALVLISAAQTQDEYFQKLRVATDEAGAGNIAAAEADIKSAIDLDPARAAGWYELGSVLGQAADFPGAEAAFRRAIQLQPDLAKAHFSLKRSTCWVLDSQIPAKRMRPLQPCSRRSS
jgi:cytochrome c-type biogenesis protein CcmH/NrfG